MPKATKLMQVYPDKTGTYQLWFRHPESKKRIKVSTGKKTEIDATNFMLQFDIERYLRVHYSGIIPESTKVLEQSQVPEPKGNVSTTSSLKDWFNHDLQHYGSDKTKSYFQSAVSSFFRHVDPNIQINELSPTHLDVWRTSLIESKQISGHNYWVIIKASFNRAKLRFQIENMFDRLQNVPSLKKGRKSLRSYAWTRDEIEIILKESRKLYMDDSLVDQTKAHLFPVIKIGLNTGMRSDEILHMRWSDVDFDGGYIRVENDPTWHSTKTYQERRIKMSAELKEFLLWHKDRQDADFKKYNGYVNPFLLERINKEFPDIDDVIEKIKAFNERYYKKYGDLHVALSTRTEIVIPYRGHVIPESSISHSFRVFLKKIDGISEERKKKIILYATRHTRGTQLADAGATSIQIRDALGHASITTSELYMSTQTDAPDIGV